jgi:hypothetical protein
MTIEGDTERARLARERLELALDLIGLIPFTTDEAHVRLSTATREVRAAADILASLDPSPGAQLDRELHALAAAAGTEPKDRQAVADPADHDAAQDR